MDTKALKILLNTYWNSGSGWIDPIDAPTSDAERDYAVKAGYMFQPKTIGHQGAIKELLKTRSNLSAERVVNGFLASLSSRRLDLRSALGSYSHAQHMSDHNFNASAVFTHDTCSICGMGENESTHDLSVLNFERFKWGGVRHSNPVYIAFDLERFGSCDALPPTKTDLSIMKEILLLIDSLPDGTSLKTLEKSLGKLPVDFPSNKGERENLMQILSYCGILQPADCPSFWNIYIDFDTRGDELPDSDWNYPISFWRGHGVNRDALNSWFPMFKNLL